MQYRFETRASDLSDLASGAVFRSAPGCPALPVRLASELFQRAHTLWAPGEPERPCNLYDPCCGAGYSLAVLKLLHWPIIRRVTGSDIDPRALDLARANLNLLEPAGIEARVRSLSHDLACFGRPAHSIALQSALRLREQIVRLSALAPLDQHVASADALDRSQIVSLVRLRGADIIFADVPYDSSTAWISDELNPAESATDLFLTSIVAATPPGTIIVAIERKGAKRVAPPGLLLLASLRGKGHRLARIFRRLDEQAGFP